MTDRPNPGPALPPSPGLFRARRERLLERIGEAVVVIGAAPELYRSRDTEVPYRPNTDLYYLTGVEEPEALAILTPFDPAHRFTLFVRPRDPERERWNGPRLGVERAKEVHGADAVYPIDEVEEQAAALLAAAERVYYPLGQSAAFDDRALGLVARARRSRPRTGTGPISVVDLDSVLAEMRKVKDEEEVARMRVAASIGAAGHRAAMARAGEGVGEWEIEAALESTFRELGATGPAFSSIVGSGVNATYLHYTTNDRRVGPGELVLVDAGAEWGMYCSDITRTFPASGRFSKEQREVYEVVLSAEEAAIAACAPGASFGDVHQAAVARIAEGLVRLGIVEGDAETAVREERYKRHYVHQTSHWLGLDVHDVGLYRESGEPVKLVAGMVLTIEPGIYLSPDDDTVPERYRGIGVRIEDDVLITAEGHELLTRDVPVDPDEIERLVGRR